MYETNAGKLSVKLPAKKSISIRLPANTPGKTYLTPKQKRRAV